MSPKSSNLLQELTDGIMELQHKLEDFRQKIGENQKVLEQYAEALTEVTVARVAINRLASVYNQEFTSGNDNKNNESPA